MRKGRYGEKCASGPGVVEIWQTLLRTSLVCGCLGFSQPDINGPHERTHPLLSKWWQNSGGGEGQVSLRKSKAKASPPTSR